MAENINFNIIVIGFCISILKCIGADDCTEKFKDPEICERGGLCLNDRCYIFSTDYKTRAEAEEFCSPLVDNKLSEKDLMEFRNLMKGDVYGVWFWVNPTRSDGTELFKWGNGSVVDVSYGENIPNRPYLILVIYSTGHHLHAVPDSFTAFAFCEAVNPCDYNPCTFTPCYQTDNTAGYTCGWGMSGAGNPFKRYDVVISLSLILITLFFK